MHSHIPPPHHYPQYINTTPLVMYSPSDPIPMMPSNPNEELITLLHNSVLAQINELSGMKSAGVLKFFNDSKNFGFFVNESDGEDVFFHFDDIKDTKLSKEFL